MNEPELELELKQEVEDELCKIRQAKSGIFVFESLTSEDKVTVLSLFRAANAAELTLLEQLKLSFDLGRSYERTRHSNNGGVG